MKYGTRLRIVAAESNAGSRVEEIKKLIEHYIKEHGKPSKQSIYNSEYIHVIEPFTGAFKSPNSRLRRFLSTLDSKNGSWREVTYDNLLECFWLHTGPEDAPANVVVFDDIENAAKNVDDLLVHLMSGTKLYQYKIKYISPYLKEIRNSKEEEIGAGWLTLEEVATLKKASIRTVKDHCQRGYLTCRRLKNKSFVVKADSVLDYWITGHDTGALYRRMLIIKDALEIYKGDSIDDIFDMVEDAETFINKFGNVARYSVKKFFSRFYPDLPKDVNLLREQIDDIISFLKEKHLSEVSRSEGIEVQSASTTTP